MGNTDSIPVVSQAKSGFQWLCRDSNGALQTQTNFIKGCPVVSQCVALGFLMVGDTNDALDNQTYFLKNLNNVVDSVPVVGHVIGLVHYACGDVEGGNDVIKSSSRTLGVVGGGIGGFLVGGPPGAWVGGIAGGATADGIITGTESLMRRKYTPSHASAKKCCFIQASFSGHKN